MIYIKYTAHQYRIDIVNENYSIQLTQLLTFFSEYYSVITSKPNAGEGMQNFTLKKPMIPN